MISVNYVVVVVARFVAESNSLTLRSEKGERQ